METDLLLLEVVVVVVAVVLHHLHEYVFASRLQR